MPADVRIPLDPDLLQDVLEPYLERCRYVTGGGIVRDARGVTLEAELAMGPSCYLSEPEPFQPPELNICYNQMLYLGLAQGIVSGLYPELADWDYARFKRHQLPDVLILEFQCRFGERAVRREAFRGSFTVGSIVPKRTLTLLRTSCAFADDRGGSAEGVVTVGIVQRKPRTA